MIHAGRIQSFADGDIDYISANRLAQLYNVRTWVAGRPHEEQDAKYVHLYPSHNYPVSKRIAENAFCKRNKIWRCADDRLLPVADLGNDHLYNAAAMLLQHGLYKSYAYIFHELALRFQPFLTRDVLGLLRASPLILADAVEEAGCDWQALLTALRNSDSKVLLRCLGRTKLSSI
jgi:hypothetical protein